MPLLDAVLVCALLPEILLLLPPPPPSGRLTAGGAGGVPVGALLRRQGAALLAVWHPVRAITCGEALDGIVRDGSAHCSGD